MENSPIRWMISSNFINEWMRQLSSVTDYILCYFFRRIIQSKDVLVCGEASSSSFELKSEWLEMYGNLEFTGQPCGSEHAMSGQGPLFELWMLQ